MRKRFAEIIRSVRSVRCAVALLVATGVLFADLSIGFAHKESVPKKERCEIPDEYKNKWEEPEKWAWKEICEGRDADFNRRPGNERLDPKDPYKWSYDYKWSDGRRTLSPSFLKTILLNETFRSAIPHRGVRISGAYFKDEIDLRDASIEWPLTLEGSLFKSMVDMRRIRTTKFVSFEGSRFDGEIDMHYASIGTDLLMQNAQFEKIVRLWNVEIGGVLAMNNSEFRELFTMWYASIGNNLFMYEAKFKKVELVITKVGNDLQMKYSKFEDTFKMDSTSIGLDLYMHDAEFKDVSLNGAKIGRSLYMDCSKFEGDLDMHSISTGYALKMSSKIPCRGYRWKKAEFKNVYLRGAKIGGVLNMNGSKFKGKLDMHYASIGDDLSMRSAKFGKVDLRRAKIGDILDMSNSEFKDEFDMNSVSVGRDLRMRNAGFDKPANLKFINVGSNFDVRSAMFRALDLTGARIKRELWLGSVDWKNIEWKGYKDKDGKSRNPKLTLRNTSVGTLQDTKDAWPPNLELDGFTYNRLGTGEKETTYERSKEWFIEWLAKDKLYSPQPYRHLAAVLRTAGHEDMADEILYANRAREHRQSDISWRRWAFLWVLWITVGYGYGWLKFLALVWVGVLVVLGSFILHIAKERDKIIAGFLNSACYSLDMLLPIIRLRDRHYKDLDLITWARYYFYFHQIMGYVLIFFVLAGLSGLVE